jgi:tetratricopeptide (TPR) repeat protein
VLGAAAGAVAIWAGTRPDPLARARQAYDRGEWQRAAEALRGGVKADAVKTADRDVVRLYARTMVRLGRDSAAGALYGGPLASAELEPEDAFLKGLSMTRTGRPTDAFDLWARHVQAGVNHPEMLDHYARLSGRFQRMDPALDAARRLCRQPGWEARGLFLLGQLDDLIDDPPGVVEALASAFRLEPEARGALFDGAHYRKLLARNLLRLGRPIEAEEALKASRMTSMEGTAPDAEADWLLSRANLQQGRMAEAANALSRTGPYRDEHRWAPEPSPYAGSSACVPCHREEARSHAATRHARTFYRGPDLLGLPLPDRPVPDPDDPGVLHAVERRGDRIEATTTIRGQAARMVVEYAFGTPEHYVTMIGRDEEKTPRALRVSHYRTATASGWGATSGDVGHSDSPDGLRGQRIDERDGVVRCLHCHVTRSRDFREPPPAGGPGPEAADRGIGCERCHGPGRNHLQAMRNGFRDSVGTPDFAIVGDAGATGATADRQCVECHTVGVAEEIERAPDDPRYVRSPGVTLALSRCFAESGGALRCITCHDPHREAEHSPRSYEAKCLSCHATPSTPPGRPGPGAGASSNDRRAAVCPVNPANDCLGCHMPRVPMPALHASLTDHYIRVRREAASPNRH